MLQNMKLVILFYIFLNASFKMTIGFAKIARTTASKIKFLYQERF